MRDLLPGCKLVTAIQITVIFDQHVINGHYNVTHMPVSDVLPTVKVAAPRLVLL